MPGVHESSLWTALKSLIPKDVSHSGVHNQCLDGLISTVSQIITN